MIMSLDYQPATYFDSPDRSNEQEIQSGKEIILSQPLISQLLEGYPNLAVILNQNRQIVAYNSKAAGLLFPDQSGEIYGQRLGEALKCIHATEMPAGCGTSKFCTECGAGKCNKKTGETLASCSEECRITTEQYDAESSLDLRVFTSNLNISGENFVLFSVDDIKNEKRRNVLEKIFFHDVLNTATAIHGISEILNSTDGMNDVNEFSGLLLNSSQQLISEIQTQRDLLNAEQGILSINPERKSVNEIISRVYDLYKEIQLTKGKNIVCEYLEKDIYLKTDSVLLIRSLGNLIKNALEASQKSEQTKIYCNVEEDSVLFNVQNDAVIPEQIQLQLFQRSFSTKAANGRGIGTYSVKLLIEQYLKGSVTFVSNTEVGTIFTLRIPFNINFDI